jgi:hypothetical protein
LFRRSPRRCGVALRVRGEPDALVWSVFGVAVLTVLLAIALPAALAPPPSADAAGAAAEGDPTVGFSPPDAPRRPRR